MSSISSDHRRWRIFLSIGTLMLALWVQPALSMDCNGVAASGVDCAGQPVPVSRLVPLVLDGRLSNPQALPPPVSSPVLDASLAQLRHEQSAIELRMRLLEHQSPTPGRPHASPHTVGSAQDEADALRAQAPEPGAVQQYLEQHAEGLITLLVGALAVCLLLLLMHYRQKRKAMRELRQQQALQKLKPVIPEWSGDLDFDLKPYVFDDRR